MVRSPFFEVIGEMMMMITMCDPKKPSFTLFFKANGDR
jgi:hypothetical protein